LMYNLSQRNNRIYKRVRILLKSQSTITRLIYLTWLDEKTFSQKHHHP